MKPPRYQRQTVAETLLQARQKAGALILGLDGLIAKDTDDHLDIAGLRAIAFDVGETIDNLRLEGRLPDEVLNLHPIET